VTRFSSGLACPCGVTGHVFWTEGGYRDCVERVVELWGEFDHRRMPGVPIGETAGYVTVERRRGRLPPVWLKE
jgi:hypothetical protein